MEDTEILAPPTQPITAVPLVGEYWPSQGGIFAGIRRNAESQSNHAVILALAKPEQKLNWADAMAWAKTVKADGHTDFVVPDRFDSALLYATVRAHFDTNAWHWTSTQYSVPSCACVQGFNYGAQDNDYKSAEARVRAVRLIQLSA